MHGCGKDLQRSPALGRALLLLLLVAGLLGMHGFAQVVGHPTSSGAHVGAPLHTTVEDPVPAPGEHHPSGVHDALMGCVLALVGIATFAAALRGAGRRRSARTSDRSPAAPVDVVHQAVLPPGPPQHLALCVQRV